MATINYSAGACEALLFTSAEIMRQNDPANLMEPVGLVQALKDPSNVAGAEFTQMGAGNGHTKQVRVVSRKPLLSSDVKTAKDCEKGDAIPRYETTATANLHAQYGATITEASIRALCEAYSAVQKLPVDARGTSEAFSVMRGVYDDVQMMFDPMRQNINKRLWAEGVPAIGTFRDGSAIKNYTILKADGSPYLMGLNQFRLDVKNTSFQGVPIVVGQGNFELAMMALEYGCCNSGGTDFGKMNGNPGFKFYSDLNVVDALGSVNEALAFMPGTMQMFAYNAYVGQFATPIDNMARGTIADPAVPGLRYDIRIQPSACPEDYAVWLNLSFGLWAAEDLFQGESEVDAGDGDPREGITGIFNINAVQAS